MPVVNPQRIVNGGVTINGHYQTNPPLTSKLRIRTKNRSTLTSINTSRRPSDQWNNRQHTQTTGGGHRYRSPSNTTTRSLRSLLEVNANMAV